MALFSDDIAFKTIIGEGSSIRGDLKISGMIRIEGDIDGNIETNGNLFVSEKARVRGNIQARSVTVCGIVQGNIIAPDHVQLFSTSAVLGDIQTHRLSAEENVIIQGHCIALSDNTLYENAVTKWNDTRAITSRAILEPIHIQSKPETKSEPKAETESRTEAASESAEQNQTENTAVFKPITLGTKIR